MGANNVILHHTNPKAENLNRKEDEILHMES